VTDLNLRKLGRLLPKAPGIMGKGDYVNSSVMVPLLRAGGEYHLLFEKRSGSIRQGGEICFPGGLFDPEKDKTPVDTALREAREEVGIGAEKVRLIGRLDTHITPMGITVDPVVALVDMKEELVINRSEVESVFILPVSFFKNTSVETYGAVTYVHPETSDENGGTKMLFPAKELGLPEKYHKPWGGHRHRIYVYKTGFGIIWGITARVIKELIGYIDRL
jgi:peroxisomal coenzyme A diphosphatase NUDT7